MKQYISQYYWKDIEVPSHKKDWKKFEQNNNTIALNILYAPHNAKEISVAYISKYNNNRKNQVILLVITYGIKCHYLAVRSLFALLRGITSSNNGDFYCLNCLIAHLIKLKKHERVWNYHDYCRVDMSEEDKNTLKYRPGEKSLKVPFIIYADLECLLKKEQSCQNNPKKSYTERKAKHKPSRYSWSLICSFDETKNKRIFYRRKVVLKSFVKM